MAPTNEQLTQNYRLLYCVSELNRLCYLSHRTHTTSTRDRIEDKIRRLYARKKTTAYQHKLLNHNQLRHRRKNTFYSFILFYFI